jgi:histidyl-tRNA synthetase
VAIDKLDKIGQDKVLEELHTQQFSEASTAMLKPLLSDSAPDNRMSEVTSLIGSDNQGLKDLNEVFSLTGNLEHVEFDPRLARGLSYYTGCIFEVQIDGVSVGSVSGGGRYDDLTGVFGLPNMSGIGFSFGVDRLYDAMEELALFPETADIFTTVLLIAFDDTSWHYCLEFLQELRKNGIRSELYPEPAKPKKQFGYADKKNIPFALIAGEEEMTSKQFSIKNMKSGDQKMVERDEAIKQLLHFQETQ